MTTCIAVFLAAFLISIGATLLVCRIAVRLGVVDKPDQFRKIHQREIPRLGGVAIYVAFVIPVAAIYLFGKDGSSVLVQADPARLLALIIGATVALALGVVDDVWGLRAPWKLLFQVIAGLVAVAGGITVAVLSNPFGGPLYLGFFAIPVTLFWFLGCMNAVNLMDGLDGLAAGVCLFVVLTLFLVSVLFGNIYSALLACLSGAIFGFLLFNFNPARIFLGDAGSILLGFLVAALSILASRKAEAAVALLIPFVALGLPILDTSIAILRRWSRNLPISAPDRQHIHHTLLSLGLSHKRVVLILYGVCVLLGSAALLITMARNSVVILVLAVLTILAFLCIRVFGRMRITDLWGKMKDDMERRQRSAEARNSVEKALIRMRSATNPLEIWQFFTSSLEALGLDYVTFRLNGANDPDTPVLKWTNPKRKTDNSSPASPDLWTARLQVRSNGHVFGELELGQSVHNANVLPDTSVLVDRLRREMSILIERLGGREQGAGSRE